MAYCCLSHIFIDYCVNGANDLECFLLSGNYTNLRVPIYLPLLLLFKCEEPEQSCSFELLITQITTNYQVNYVTKTKSANYNDVHKGEFETEIIGRISQVTALSNIYSICLENKTITKINK